jgi:hypothetical protein
MLDVSMAPDADNNHNNLYAVGSTLHANVSAMYSLPAGPKLGSFSLWQSAMFLAEIGGQQLVHITEKPEARMLNRGGDHHAVKMQAVFDPMYYQVLPNLDLDAPIAFGYNPSGTSL